MPSGRPNIWRNHTWPELAAETGWRGPWLAGAKRLAQGADPTETKPQQAVVAATTKETMDGAGRFANAGMAAARKNQRLAQRH